MKAARRRPKAPADVGPITDQISVITHIANDLAIIGLILDHQNQLAST
jgi:hypothetical protein